MFAKSAPDLCRGLEECGKIQWSICVPSFCRILEAGYFNWCSTPLIYILLSILLLGGVTVMIFFTSMITPPGLPGCDCPLEDYGLISSVVIPAEPGTLTLADTEYIVRYGVFTTPVNNSVTSNASKFNVTTTGFPPFGIIYTPVFTGPEVKIIGTGAATIYITNPDVALLFFNVTFGVMWINSLTAVGTRITQSTIRIVNSTPTASTTFSVPYAISFTPAQIAASGGTVAIVLYIYIPSSTSLISFDRAVAAISISANEVQ